MLKQWLIKLLSIAVMTNMLMACAPFERGTYQRPRASSSSAQAGDTLLRQADQAEARRDYATARTYYQLYLEQSPGGVYETEALTKLGKIHEIMGDHTAALNVYRKVETEHPHSLWAAEAILNAGRLYLNSNDIPAALAQADKALNNNNTSDDQKRRSYLLKADSYTRQQAPEPAVTAMMQAYNLTDPQLLPNLKKEIQDYIRNVETGTLTAAEKQLPRGMAHNWLTYLIGIRLMDESQNQAALERLSATVAADPRSSYADDARSRIERLNRLTTPETSTIGCLLPLSGPYQAIGESALAGIELALHELGRRNQNYQFSISVADTAGDDTKALAALERLKNKKVAAIIGPIITAQAVSRQADQMGIPLLALNQSAGIPQTGPYIFRNFITPQMQVRALVDYAVTAQGIDRLAILYPDEKYGQYYANLFRTEVQALGGQITKEAIYTPGSTDFKESIQTLTKSGPGFGALFIPDAADTVGLILPQLRFYDIKNKLLLGTNLWYTEKLIAMAAPYARKAVCPADFFKESSSRQVSQFVTSMGNTYHKKPSYISAIAYDTAAILFKAMTTALDDPDSIREALTQMPPHDGLTGKSWFEENGESSREITLVRIQDDRFEAVEEK